jgi:transposase-like protein
MPRKAYLPEFRRRALDLIASGRKVVDAARDLGMSDQTLYTWRRISELESEAAIHRRAAELLKERTDPKAGSRRSR